MNQIDIYYRAFKDYRRETADNTACKKDRNAILKSNPEEDKLTAVKYLCKIEEDWVKAIEEGLVFVEKAVAEERQFIRTNGEVIPIEKVRKVSKDSVEHLAKHSEMITHVPESEDSPLIPDKLYMVEKLSDYAVYENRFLYMMLCYLKNFIEFRLEKIETLRRSYTGDFSVSKEIATKKRTLKIKTEIYEQRTDNPFPLSDESSASLVKRISDCREIINSLLNTDLMMQVAKVPMIKPPIVKTNVLKMNNNFKRALALYDFIASYKGLGYSYEEVKFDFSPFAETFGDEIAESLNLTSFLAYKTGNQIEDYLESEYQKEEQRRKQLEAQKLVERIKRLKKRAAESGKTMEEYMLLLEERNRQLEKDSEELNRIRKEVELLNERIEELNAQTAELNRRIEILAEELEAKEREIVELNRKYIEDIAALKKEHESAIAQLQSAHETEITELKAEFSDRLTVTVNEYESKVAALNAEAQQMREAHATAVSEYEAKIASMIDRVENVDREIGRLADEYQAKLKVYEQNCEENLKAAISGYEENLKTAETNYKREMNTMKDEVAFCRGELDAMRIQSGLMTPSTEYTSRERFKELENEYEAFQKFFKKQWKFTKKEIRKTLLWKKEEKRNKKK